MVEERADRHGQPAAQPSLPQAVDQAVRADGRPEHGRVGQHADRQPGDDDGARGGARLGRVHRERGGRLQRGVPVMVVRKLAGPVERVQYTADQVIGARVLGHHRRPERRRDAGDGRRTLAVAARLAIPAVALERQLAAQRQPAAAAHLNGLHAQRPFRDQRWTEAGQLW